MKKETITSVSLSIGLAFLSIVIVIIVSSIVLNYVPDRQSDEFTSEEIIEIKTEIETLSLYEVALSNMNMDLEEIKGITNKYEWFVEYKAIIERYSDIIPIQSVYKNYTQEDIEFMWCCVETETYTADFESKCNVASVILNRSHSHNMNIKDVIISPNQFSYWRTEISDTTKLAVEYVLQFGDTTNGCRAFRSDSNPNNWYSWSYQFTDNVGHHFYK